jgi:hypothetical protein
MSDVVETVRIVCADLVGGFMRINKTDFIDGVHEIFEGVEEVAQSLGLPFMADVGGHPVSAEGAGAGQDGGPPVSDAAGAGGWGHHPDTQPAPPPIEPQTVTEADAAKVTKGK